MYCTHQLGKHESKYILIYTKCLLLTASSSLYAKHFCKALLWCPGKQRLKRGVVKRWVQTHLPSWQLSWRGRGKEERAGAEEGSNRSGLYSSRSGLYSSLPTLYPHCCILRAAEGPSTPVGTGAAGAWVQLWGWTHQYFQGESSDWRSFTNRQICNFSPPSLCKAG